MTLEVLHLENENVPVKTTSAPEGFASSSTVHGASFAVNVLNICMYVAVWALLRSIG